MNGPKRITDLDAVVASALPTDAYFVADASEFSSAQKVLASSIVFQDLTTFKAIVRAKLLGSGPYYSLFIDGQTYSPFAFYASGPTNATQHFVLVDGQLTVQFGAAFWAQTPPASQPADIGAVNADVNDLQTKVNAIRTILRAYGFTT